MLRCFLITFLASIQAVHAVSDTVDLGYSKYRGITSGTGVKAWLGIRYAAPPLGKLRFAAPVDPLPTHSTIDANRHGYTCISTGASYASSVSSGTSEDCLFLDVYAPANAANLPVYFFIQGGGFNSNSNANLNGTSLIKASGGNIVVVNFNYRVGPYGFLASKEVQSGGSLNNGLKDQRKALDWVQKYISRFGGNPDHVVLGGASAGAASITLQLTAYGGRDDGLFHATAAESQSFGTILTVNESQYVYDALVSRTGCSGAGNTLACLRHLNTSTLQDNNINIPFPNATAPPLYLYGPTLDHEFVPFYTYDAYGRDAYVKLPSIYGDDTNEGTVFTPKSTNSLNESDTFLKNQFPFMNSTDLEWFNQNYPKAEQFPGTGAYWRQVSNAYGEVRYICPGIYISGVNSHNDIKGNWNYRWNVKTEADENSGIGVGHTAEVGWIWGTTSTNKVMIPIVQAYWTSFIRTFDPNTYKLPDMPVWQDFNYGDGFMRLKFETNSTQMEMIDEGQQDRCAWLSMSSNAVRWRQ